MCCGRLRRLTRERFLTPANRLGEPKADKKELDREKPDDKRDLKNEGITGK